MLQLLTVHLRGELVQLQLGAEVLPDGVSGGLGQGCGRPGLALQGPGRLLLRLNLLRNAVREPGQVVPARFQGRGWGGECMRQAKVQELRWATCRCTQGGRGPLVR
jgi:hypothetical protein